ncbi:MAG: DUF4199 domain-containing protein [Algoriphagus sp.]|jgi:hypothetical protein|nr:DUF4199 domain-containing protein [Algoriphagus sp.]
MNEQAPSPIQSAVRPGLIIGLVSLVITYVAYFIDSSYLASGYFGLIALVLFFGLIIFFGKEFRKESGGFLTFGAAFNFSFFAILISGVIGLIGNILLFHVIDPTLPQVLGDLTFETQLEMMENFGQNPDSMPTEALDKMKEASASNFTLVGQLKGFGFGLVAYAIIALILGAILKKRDKSLDF